MKSFAYAAIAGTAAAAGGNWGYYTMGKDWTVQCATGQHQSPIDLNAKDKAEFSLKIQNFGDQTGLHTHIHGKTGTYANGALYLKRKDNPAEEIGRRLQTHGKVKNVLQLDADGDIELKRNEKDGATLHYQPNQLHVHAPSEHTIGGKYFDMEMHFVMLPHSATGDAHEKFVKEQKAKEGDADYKVNYAVLGVMFTETDCKDDAGKAIKECEAKLKMTDSFFESMNMDQIKQGSKGPIENRNDSWVKADKVPLKSFMDSLDTSQFYAYEGSLTTPPCWEGVRWSVLKNALPVSKKQLGLVTRNYAGNEKFAKLKGNNRVIMPLNDRKLFFIDNGALSLAATTMAGLATAAYLF